MNIRRANILDARALSACSLESLPIGFTVSDFASCIESLDFIVLIAETSGTRQPVLMGYMVCNIELSKYHIMSFAVYEEYRNKCVGGQIMKWMKDLCQIKHKNMSLYVHVENIGAIEFYKKHIFMIDHTHHDYYKNSLRGVKSYDAFFMIYTYNPII